MSDPLSAAAAAVGQSTRRQKRRLPTSDEEDDDDEDPDYPVNKLLRSLDDDDDDTAPAAAAAAAASGSKLSCEESKIPVPDFDIPGLKLAYASETLKDTDVHLVKDYSTELSTANMHVTAVSMQNKTIMMVKCFSLHVDDSKCEYLRTALKNALKKPRANLDDAITVDIGEGVFPDAWHMLWFFEFEISNTALDPDLFWPHTGFKSLSGECAWLSILRFMQCPNEKRIAVMIKRVKVNQDSNEKDHDPYFSMLLRISEENKSVPLLEYCVDRFSVHGNYDAIPFNVISASWAYKLNSLLFNTALMCRDVRAALENFQVNHAGTYDTLRYISKVVKYDGIN
jgi:hypothetical protein